MREIFPLDCPARADVDAGKHGQEQRKQKQARIVSKQPLERNLRASCSYQIVAQRESKHSPSEGLGGNWCGGQRAERPSVPDGHFVGHDIAFFIAPGLDCADGEAPIVQVRPGLLQGIVQIVLQGRGAFGRSQHARIHAIDFVLSRSWRAVRPGWYSRASLPAAGRGTIPAASAAQTPGSG